MAVSQMFPGSQQTFPTTFTVGNTTLGKIIVPRTPAATSINVLPAQPDLTLQGGCRIIAGEIASTDGSARSMLFYVGRRTFITGVQTGALTTIATQNVLTRSAGSFLNDTVADNNGQAWQIGDNAMIFKSGTAANNGALATVTAVTATTLTFNGTPFTNDGAIAATTELYRVALRTRKGIPLNSGNTDSAAPIQLIGGSQDVDLASQPDLGLSFGPDDVLIGAMVANISALPAYISVAAHVLLY